jgi:hypothetical protein
MNKASLGKRGPTLPSGLSLNPSSSGRNPAGMPSEICAQFLPSAGSMNKHHFFPNVTLMTSSGFLKELSAGTQSKIVREEVASAPSPTAGGENVYSGEVEAVILSHPAVREAAVFGIPDPTFEKMFEGVNVTPFDWPVVPLV